MDGSDIDFFLAAFCYETNPFADSALGDPTWFAYIGRMWLNGHVPYLEYFDHKGPLIFFLNMLGLAISQESYLGVWCIELVFLLSSFRTVYSYVNEFRGKTEAVVVLGVVTAAMLKLTSPCDSIESFAYPIVTFCLIRLMTLIKRGESLSCHDAFLFGVAFMALFLLKANLVSVAFVIAVYYFQTWFQDRRTGRFLCNSALTFLGMAIVLLPFVGYFYVKGALYDFWYCAIVYNINYANKTAVFNALLPCVYVLNVLNLGLLFVRSVDKKVLAYNQIFLILTGLTLWQCPTYDHYYVLIVPGIIPLLVEIWGLMPNITLLRKGTLTLLFVFSICVLSTKVLTANFDVGGWARNIRNGGSLFSILEYKEGRQFAETLKFLELIDDRDSVLCFGRNGLYEYLKVSTRFKYFLHTTCELDERMHSASIENLKSRNDKYVIAYKPEVVNEWAVILNEGYEVVCESDKYYLYKRKYAVSGASKNGQASASEDRREN